MNNEKLRYCEWDNSWHESGCNYMLPDGPDDICKECDCQEDAAEEAMIKKLMCMIENEKTFLKAFQRARKVTQKEVLNEEESLRCLKNFIEKSIISEDRIKTKIKALKQDIRKLNKIMKENNGTDI